MDVAEVIFRNFTDLLQAARTPDHIKKKVVELLYLWSTKELKGETKISEAYLMLKKQGKFSTYNYLIVIIFHTCKSKLGIVQEDPVYVGDAVFASALPPRKSAPLSDEESQRLRRLLQSKSPDDLQMANKIIKVEGVRKKSRIGKILKLA